MKIDYIFNQSTWIWFWSECVFLYLDEKKKFLTYLPANWEHGMYDRSIAKPNHELIQSAFCSFEIVLSSFVFDQLEIIAHDFAPKQIQIKSQNLLLQFYIVLQFPGFIKWQRNKKKIKENK